MDLLASYQKQFAYYRYLGERAMEQLSEEEIFRNDFAQSNSVAIIVKHLAGNMKSRWTDVLHTDGEKPWRDRDGEFIADLPDGESLYNLWTEGWTVLESTLSSLQPTDLDQIIFIRNEGHTLFEAINRQLAHYSYHVGQIVLLAKQMKGGEWTSLSISKGASKEFNSRKFSEEKGRRHFTDDLMSNNSKE